MEFRIETNNSEVHNRIRRKLDAYNHLHDPSRNGEALTIEILDAGDLLAGAIMLDDWGWLKILAIWVGEDARGRGLGRKMVERAEHIARSRALRGLYVETTSFQSPKFYEQCGFKCFGTVDDMPPGHQSFFYHKYL